MNKGYPSGVELMKQISEGKLQQAPTEFVQQQRAKITEACEELLELGARVRPLFTGKEQIGWVRGIHPSERKILERWVLDKMDLAVQIMTLATTLTKEEIEAFSSAEFRSLLSLVRQMTDRDLSLYPYLAAYTSTTSSEGLWYGMGTQLSAFGSRQMEMPDGKKMKILAPPDHARLWAALCNYREQAKQRLDHNFNAVLIIRPWAGKNADPIAAELKNVARTLRPDALEPWQNVIKTAPSVDVNDGWAHPGESIEDLKREMKGFIDGDRHERVMKKFDQQMRDEAEARKQKLEELIQKRGGPGVYESEPTIYTDAEVRERERALKQGRPVIKPVDRDKTEIHNIPKEKIQKYR
jgi:hypothetical protein